MEFSLNLAVILNKMRNEYDESFEDLGISWRKVSDLLVSGELEFKVVGYWTGDYLILDIPEKLIKKRKCDLNE